MYLNSETDSTNKEEESNINRVGNELEEKYTIGYNRLN